MSQRSAAIAAIRAATGATVIACPDAFDATFGDVDGAIARLLEPARAERRRRVAILAAKHDLPPEMVERAMDHVGEDRCWNVCHYEPAPPPIPTTELAAEVEIKELFRYVRDPATDAELTLLHATGVRPS
jgi:hypothetical protein